MATTKLGRYLLALITIIFGAFVSWQIADVMLDARHNILVGCLLAILAGCSFISFVAIASFIITGPKESASPCTCGKGKTCVCLF